MHTRPGLTLTELLIVLAILVSLVVMTVVVTSRTVKNSEFDRVRETIRGELTRAQADSIAGSLDSAWGAMVTATSVTRYKGSSFATRTRSFDVISSFGNVMAKGSVDVRFTRPKGVPISAATIVIADGTQTATTTVSPAGAISVQ